MKDLAQFDIPARVYEGEEQIAVLVGVHLHLEAFIIELIARRLAKPEALDLDRLNFPSKLGLAVALDVVPEIAVPALKTINSIRNRIAHNLAAELTQDDANLLKGQVSFVGATSRAGEDNLPPGRRIAHCSLLLQAWLNGVVEAAELRGQRMSRAELEARAVSRYPPPVEPDAQNA